MNTLLTVCFLETSKGLLFNAGISSAKQKTAKIKFKKPLSKGTNMWKERPLCVSAYTKLLPVAY